MSYSTINRCAQDPALIGRLTSCCAAEGAQHPSAIAAQLIWRIATSSDIAAAYASALVSNNQNPGGDESVITDQMILSAVQANWPG